MVELRRKHYAVLESGLQKVMTQRAALCTDLMLEHASQKAMAEEAKRKCDEMDASDQAMSTSVNRHNKWVPEHERTMKTNDLASQLHVSINEALDAKMRGHQLEGDSREIQKDNRRKDEEI